MRTGSHRMTPMSRRAAAFTLIELLIVLAIGIVLLSIALTSLSKARLASNESQAVAALRHVAVTETAWRQNDADGNGKADFWTQDWSGLYRVANKDGAPWGLISADLAKADGAPALATTGGARPQVTAMLVSAKAVPHAGYFFRAMVSDNSARVLLKDGSTLDGEIVASSKDEITLKTDTGLVTLASGTIVNISAASLPFGAQNPSKFAFTAWPAEPEASGHHVLILLESGAIWAKDLEGPGPGGAAPAGTVLMENAKGGQLTWPGEPGSRVLNGTEEDAWKSVQ
jgi:type II secretory pathway pseudopilin PulG